MSAPTAEPVAYWFQKHNCFGQLVWDIAFSAPRDATQVVPLYAAATEAKPAQDAVDAWVHFDELYIKACATSLPTHWMDAALAAQQIRAAISAKKGGAV